MTGTQRAQHHRLDRVHGQVSVLMVTVVIGYLKSEALSPRVHLLTGIELPALVIHDTLGKLLRRVAHGEVEEGVVLA